MNARESFELPLLGAEDRTALPRVRPVRQLFERTAVDDVEAAASAAVAAPAIEALVRPGESIAVGVGSRGISGYAEAVRATVRALRERGAEPFIVPAMGSHGAATAEGQRQVLEESGIDEASVGAPVRATMEVVELGRIEDGTPIYLDAHAARADGVVVVNRVKPHTAFRGSVESGLAKIAVAGLGKTQGVVALHDGGASALSERIRQGFELVRQRVPLRFGVAMLENGYGELAHVEAAPADRILAREAELLERARELMPKLRFDALDVLVLQRVGKDISGQGLDPNVVGRNVRGVDVYDGPSIDKLVALELSTKSHGNALGIGVADVITAAMLRAIDFDATHRNVLSTNLLDLAALPMVARSPADAVALAIGATANRSADRVRLVYARDTKDLTTLWVSEALFADVRDHPALEFTGPAQPLADGDALAPRWPEDSG